HTTWNAWWNQASNATYLIYDGTTLVRTVVVDQRPAPSGTTVNGVVFQTLATVNVSSGTLRVVLSDNANGDVVADAVQLISNTTPPPPPPPPTGPVIIDNGAPGYSETGSGWLSWATGYNGSVRYAHAGSGANTATWQATGLASGSYTVQTTWNASANHAANATYQVYDGTTLL